MSELLVQTRDLERTYVKESVAIPVIRDLNFSLHRGECVAIVGASGVGKSTLLNMLGALDRPTGGTIEFRGKPMAGESDQNLARFRNEEVGFVFQFHYLLPEFTALENVEMPLRIRGSKDLTRARTLLEEVGLSNRLRHRPTELSGGEQQRVAIARALVHNPGLILADEPTGNLDLQNAELVGNLLFSMVRDSRKSLVLVTHNMELASRADRILRMRGGTLDTEKAKE